MNSKKNIIELCMSPDLGGLELYMIRTAIALENNFNVSVVINETSKLSAYISKEQNCIKIQKESNIFMFKSAMILAKFIQSAKIDIVHIHWTKDIPFVVLAKMLSKRKVSIVQSRHMTMTRFKSDFYHKFLYKNIELIIAVTNQVKEQLQKYIPSEIRPRVETLYIGSKLFTKSSIDELQKFKKNVNMESDFFNVGMIGRISKAKGQYLLIEALAKTKNQNIRIYFAGSEMQKGYIEELKSLANSLNISQQLVFLGFLKNPNIFYEACDTIVLASKNETFGLVLTESMSAGTAVIGSNSGGVLEIIDDMNDGLLFVSGDSDDLAKKITLLEESSELLQKLTKNAEAKILQKFNDDTQFQKLSDLLNSLD